MGAGCIYCSYTGKRIYKKEIMKNKTLIYLLLGAGALYLIAAKKKPKGYQIIVPEPEKISKEQFEKSSFDQKAIPVVKKIVQAAKQKKLTAKQQQAIKTLSSGRRLFGQVGEFPDLY